MGKKRVSEAVFGEISMATAVFGLEIKCFKKYDILSVQNLGILSGMVNFFWNLVRHFIFQSVGIEITTPLN